MSKDYGLTDHARMNRVTDQAFVELETACRKFPPFNSAHEGFAVLAEEVDELWDEVKAKQGARDVEAMRKEAVQVAATALRFIVDVCDTQRGAEVTHAEHRRRVAWELLKKLADDAKRGDYDLVLDPEIILLACGDEVGQT